MMETATANQTRVWLYRSVQKLSPEIESTILQKGKDFIGQWASHGNKLAAEFEIVDHHFLVFFVDQSWAKASGCSIDSSVAFIKEIENTYQLGLLDRQKIGFKVKGEIVFHDFNQLKELYDRGTIKDDTMIYDLLIQSKVEYQQNFLIPFSDSPYFRTVQ